MATSGTPITKLALARIMRPFQQFVETGSIGGIILLATTVVALLWANSPWAESYHHLWEHEVAVGPAAAPLVLSVHMWINDALMAVFFLLVGLEIKRELMVGELATPRQAALPIMAALGGMIVPALIYTSFNAGGPGSPGWGVPMATDIAFALGVITLLGPRVPVGLKVFLTALAIVDDLGAVLVIALFYTASLNMAALLGAAVAFAVLLVLNRYHVLKLTPYLLVGVVLWFFVLKSGVHATIAGVLLALTIPASTRTNAQDFSARMRSLLQEFDRAETGSGNLVANRGQQEMLALMDHAASDVNAPLLRLEHVLNRPVAFFIMPIFALSNAGVALGDVGATLATPIALGIMLGLFFGKMIGISLFSWLSVRLGWASLPQYTGWSGIVGTAVLGGIGFTMSLFIAGLAFPDPVLLDEAKIGILVGSTIAGIVGFVVLRRTLPDRSRAPVSTA
jgi:NhaA family Na+:H+ antiporter